MREKKMRYLVTFHTTVGAMAMEKFCKNNNLPGRLIPVPREITAGCGMAWCADIEDRERLHPVLETEKMDYDKEYEMKL